MDCLNRFIRQKPLLVGKLAVVCMQRALGGTTIVLETTLWFMQRKTSLFTNNQNAHAQEEAFASRYAEWANAEVDNSILDSNHLTSFIKQKIINTVAHNNKKNCYTSLVKLSLMIYLVYLLKNDSEILDGDDRGHDPRVAWWLSGRALDLRFRGRGFNSWPVAFT